MMDFANLNTQEVDKENVFRLLIFLTLLDIDLSKARIISGWEHFKNGQISSISVQGKNLSKQIC